MPIVAATVRRPLRAHLSTVSSATSGILREYRFKLSYVLATINLPLLSDNHHLFARNMGHALSKSFVRDPSAFSTPYTPSASSLVSDQETTGWRTFDYVIVGGGV